MKKVIFICLLSVAVCLSSPTTDVKPGDPAATGSIHPDQNLSTQSNGTITPGNKQVTPAIADNTTQGVTTLKPEKNSSTNSSTAKNETSDSGNKVPTTTAQAPANVSPNSTVTSPAVIVPTQQTPAKNDSAPVTPPSAATVSTTPAHVKPTDSPSKEGDKVVQARGFDGASFIGGIILTLGLLAIGFMGFKYYKNQTERNYHTL